MRKLIRAMIICMMLSLLSACTAYIPTESGGTAGSDMSSSISEQPDSETSKDSVSEAKPPVSIDPSSTADSSSSSASSSELNSLDFLTPEQKSVYEAAQNASYYILGDPSNVCSISGNTFIKEVQEEDPAYRYALVGGNDQSYEEFCNRMLSIFTQKCLDSMDFYSRFKSFDGQLGARSAGVGSNISLAQTPDTYELVAADENTVQFTLTAHYIYQGENESNDAFMTRMESGAFDETASFTIRLVKTESGWRVDEFHDPKYSRQ